MDVVEQCSESLHCLFNAHSYCVVTVHSCRMGTLHSWWQPAMDMKILSRSFSHWGLQLTSLIEWAHVLHRVCCIVIRKLRANCITDLCAITIVSMFCHMLYTHETTLPLTMYMYICASLQDGETALMVANKSDRSNQPTIKLLEEAESHVSLYTSISYSDHGCFSSCRLKYMYIYQNIFFIYFAYFSLFSLIS